MGGWNGYWRTNDDHISELKAEILDTIKSIVGGYDCEFIDCNIEKRVFFIKGEKANKKECIAHLDKYVKKKYEGDMKIILKYGINREG